MNNRVSFDFCQLLNGQVEIKPIIYQSSHFVTLIQQAVFETFSTQQKKLAFKKRKINLHFIIHIWLSCATMS